MQSQPRKMLSIATALLLAIIGPVSAASSSHSLVQVKVQNSAQLINAMLAATRTRPTIIQLAPGHYQFTRLFNSPFGSSVLPPVNSTVSVVGQSAASTSIEICQNGRAFTLLKGGKLLLQNLTITCGNVLCVESLPPNSDCATNGGGAVENAGGSLVIEDCILTGNSVGVDGGGVEGFGGAVFNLAGQLELDRTTVSGNSTQGSGGGLAQTAGTVLVSHSVITGNSSVFGRAAGEGGLNRGGGIYVAAGNLHIITSTISHNVTGKDGFSESLSFGGGIDNEAGSILLFNSAVTENSEIAAAGWGGGILNAGKMQILNTTIGGNFGETSGGGIYNEGRLALAGVSVLANTLVGSASPLIPFPPGCDVSAVQLCLAAGGGLFSDPSGTANILDTVIALNLDSGASDCSGVLVSEGHNALGDATNCTLDPSSALHSGSTHDVVNIDPKVGALQDNGLDGDAHYPLLAGSPLIDAGGRVDTDCTSRDQLGELRVDGDHDNDQGAICDIGAIEFHPTP